MRVIRIEKRGRGGALREVLERDLNTAQFEAATAPGGYHLILAGPGTGKTRVITYRVAHLIAEGIPPDGILLVTFTRKAAREMVGRLEALIGPAATRVWAGTFHHVCHRILRRSAQTLGFDPNFTIIDGEDQVDLVAQAMDDAGLSGTGRYAPKPAVVQGMISFGFNTGRSLDEVVALRAPDFLELLPAFQAAAQAYVTRKKAMNCLDYDDLLGLCQRLVSEFPAERERLGRQFQHVLIDEMQDTNAVQVELVEAIAAAGHQNLTAVGDDAQSIYGFRGAHYANILKFTERHPTSRLHKLEVNYRSTPEIVALTNASIAQNQERYDKTLVSARESGSLPMIVPAGDAYEEAELVTHLVLEAHEAGEGLGRMAVLYRNHHDSILLQGELSSRQIPYTVRSGVRFFELRHIKDVMSYLRIVANPREETAWRRLLLLLPGIGKARTNQILEKLADSAEPWAVLRSRLMMDLLPPKSKGAFAGFVADLDRVRACEPESRPADAIAAVLKGAYPRVVKTQYDNAENRLADLEQLAVLAARYDSLDRFLADLVLAGDVYGAETFNAEDPSERLVLSTVHQAKGLEWKRVFVIRLVEEGFPSARSLREPGGEEEERRIFYVAVTRAQDELVLTYPQMTNRPGRGTLVTRPSRFLTELEPELYETVRVESQNPLAWGGSVSAADSLPADPGLPDDPADGQD